MIIHQALHGYSQGHNRLGCSSKLSASDDDCMKMLSDWSEYTDGEDNSYITAYPLQDSSFYVVAKTWYAKEMHRPGCVWTHSLLIDINALSEDFDFRCLSNLFRKPVEGDYAFYNSPIEYKAVNIERTTFTLQSVVYLYANIVGGRMRSFYRAEQSSAAYQKLCLLLMQYLPLDILRETSFCSGCSSPRRFSNGTRELQVSSTTGELLSKTVSLSVDSISETCEGIVSICEAMLDENSDTDRTLRMFSSDIEDDGKKLCAFGLLMKMLDERLASNGVATKFSDVVDILQMAFPSITDGQHLKQTFCQSRISNLFDEEVHVLSDMVTRVDDGVFDYSSLGYEDRVVKLYQTQGIKDVSIYLKALTESDSLNSAGVENLHLLANVMSVDDYMFLMSHEWNTFRSLIIMNRKILNHGFWINLPEDKFLPLYNEFRKEPAPDFDEWHSLFLIVLYKGYEIDERMLTLFVANVKTLVPDIMDYLNGSIDYRLCPLLKKHCVASAQQVLDWIYAKETVTSNTIFQFVVDVVNPSDESIKQHSSKIWQDFCYQDRIASLRYYSFVFILGYNWKDALGLACIKKGFYPLHQALSKSLLPYSMWCKIEPYTAKLSFIKEWDQCKKLRKGVSLYLKSCGYSIDVLNNFTPDKEINSQLLRYWK